jgi:hypothetical protein
MEWTQAQRALIESYVAPDGFVWVCAACGKLSKVRTGEHSETTYGWDASCFLNAVLVKENDYDLGEDGRVCKINEIAYGGPEEDDDESS